MVQTEYSVVTTNNFNVVCIIVVCIPSNMYYFIKIDGNNIFVLDSYTYINKVTLNCTQLLYFVMTTTP